MELLSAIIFALSVWFLIKKGICVKIIHNIDDKTINIALNLNNKSIKKQKENCKATDKKELVDGIPCDCGYNLGQKDIIDVQIIEENGIVSKNIKYLCAKCSKFLTITK